MKKESFDIFVDGGEDEILDWIHSHFSNGNWNKNFEVEVSLKEFEYNEDGTKKYID